MNPYLEEARVRAARRTCPVALAALCVTLAAQTAAAQTCPPERVNITSAGVQANAPTDWLSTSGDGRCVAFDTQAGLVPEDQNNNWDCYVHDRVTGTTELVSLDSMGNLGNNWGGWPEISGDGNLVLFTSTATDLVPGDANGVWDLFVRDRAAGTTELVSVATDGTQGDDHCGNGIEQISLDGRWVTFPSAATTLVPNDTAGFKDVFLRDLQTGTTSLVSEAFGGGFGNQDSGFGNDMGISGDGQWVTFTSYATDLVPGGANGIQQIFLRDTVNGVTTLVSAGMSGTGGNQDSYSPHISSDGNLVIYHSDATDLGPADLNNRGDVFLFDRLAGTTEIVSLRSDGTQGNQTSGWFTTGWIDGNGRYVVFPSDATNLVDGDTNGVRDIFVRDRWTQQTTRLSVGLFGQGNGRCDYPRISDDSSTVAFNSSASNLQQGDTNGVVDIFAESCPGPAGFPYCFGDGGGMACPCANLGGPGEGCANSTGDGGVLYTGGTASVSADDLGFAAEHLRPNNPSLLFVGLDALNGGQGFSFGDGLRCAGTAVVRLGTETPAGDGTASWGPGLGGLGGWGPGDTRRFQGWYRDPGGPCASGFNLTNGIEVVFGP